MTLTRTAKRIDGIVSRLTDDEGEQVAITLEHAYQEDDGSYEPILPLGTYQCVRGLHQLAHGEPFETFEITRVLGHTGILFHVGNFNDDSNGCVLLGEYEKVGPIGTMITHSGFTFERFMANLKGINSFQLKVVDDNVPLPILRPSVDA